jgi:hypothetical protein
MPPRTWLVFGIVTVVCGIPCSAQRINSFGSRAGGFGRGPGFTHMGSRGFSQRGDGLSVRPPAFSGVPRSQSVPSMRSFREWPGGPQFSRNEALAMGSGRARPLVPRPPLRPSLPEAGRTIVAPRPPLTSAMPIRAGASAVPRPPQASVVPVQAEASAVPRPPRTSAVPVQAAISAAPRPATRFGTNGQFFEPRSRVLFSSRQFFFNPFFPNAFLFPRPFFFSPFFARPFFFPEPFFFSPFFADAFFFPGPFFFSLFFSNAFFFPEPFFSSPFLPNAFFPQPFFFSFGSSPFFFGPPFRSPFLSSSVVPFTSRPGAIENHVHLLGTGGLSSAGFTTRQP